MENRNEILNELNVVAPVLFTVGNANLYTVPQSYFENLADEVMRKMQQPVLPAQSVTQSFHVPENYFEGLAAGIMQKIKSAQSIGNEVFTELEEIAPLLNTISKANIYIVPEAYFQSFQVILPAPAKVVTMWPRKKWYMYASAAAVACVLIMGGAIWFKQNSRVSKDNFPLVAVDVQKEVSAIPDEDIISYLSRQPGAGEATNLYDEQEPDVKEYIKNADTEEIRQFLEENPAPGENVLKGI